MGIHPRCSETRQAREQEQRTQFDIRSEGWIEADFWHLHQYIVGRHGSGKTQSAAILRYISTVLPF